MPSCRCSRPPSAWVRHSSVSSADAPLRKNARPSGPYRGFAYACVAIAPTPGSAHETTEPTARNFDSTATPHWPASRSQAAIEKVATMGSAIGQLHQVELQQILSALRYEHAGHFGASERRLHGFGRIGPHHDRGSFLVRLLKAFQ